MKIQFLMKTDGGLNDLLDPSKPFHFEGIDPDNVDGDAVREALSVAILESNQAIYPGNTIAVVTWEEEMDRLD